MAPPPAPPPPASGSDCSARRAFSWNSGMAAAAAAAATSDTCSPRSQPVRRNLHSSSMVRGGGGGGHSGTQRDHPYMCLAQEQQQQRQLAVSATAVWLGLFYRSPPPSGFLLCVMRTHQCITASPPKKATAHCSLIRPPPSCCVAPVWPAAVCDAHQPAQVAYDGKHVTQAWGGEGGVRVEVEGEFQRAGDMQVWVGCRMGGVVCVWGGKG